MVSQSSTYSDPSTSDLSDRIGDRTDAAISDAEYGTSRAARSLNDGIESARTGVTRAVARAEDATRRGLERARMAASEVKYRAADYGDAAVHQIQDRPVRSVLMAVAFGAAATLLVQWLSRSRHPY